MQYTNYDQIEWTKPKYSIENTCYFIKYPNKQTQEFRLSFYPDKHNIENFQHRHCYNCPKHNCPYWQCKNQYAPNKILSNTNTAIQYQSETDTINCLKCQKYNNCWFAHENYVVHFCDESENVPVIPGSITDKYQQTQNENKRKNTREIMCKLEKDRQNEEEYLKKHPIILPPENNEKPPNIIDIIIAMNSW